MEETPALILFALKGLNRKAKGCVNSLRLPMATIRCVETREAGRGAWESPFCTRRLEFPLDARS